MITKRKARNEIEAALMRKAVGYKLHEEKIITEEDANGAVKTKREQTIKEVGPDQPTGMMLLRAIDPGRWAADSAKPADSVIQVVSQMPRPNFAESDGQGDDPSAEL